MKKRKKSGKIRRKICYYVYNQKRADANLALFSFRQEGKQMKTAVYFGSREIYEDMVTSCKSLLMHTDVDKVYFLTENVVFPYEIPKIVENIDIRDIVPQIYENGNPNWRTEWTYIGLIRTALTKVFPDQDRILSIDCDTIVDADISELWDLDIDGYYFAAVREPLLSKQLGMLYTNVGITLMNLKKLREDGKDDEMIHALNTRYYRFVCQDVMNELCQGKILELPSEYNVSQVTAPTDNGKIFHYAGRRVTWRNENLVQMYKNKPWSK